MLDTLFKLLGALGIVVLCIQLFEWIFYRKMQGRGCLFVDLCDADEAVCLENLDLVSTALSRTCSKSLITKVYILINEKSAMDKDDLISAAFLLDLHVDILIKKSGPPPSDKNNSESFRENLTATEKPF